MLHDSVSLMCHVGNYCSPQVPAGVERSLLVSTLAQSQAAMDCMEKTVAGAFGLKYKCPVISTIDQYE